MIFDTSSKHLLTGNNPAVDPLSPPSVPGEEPPAYSPPPSTSGSPQRSRQPEQPSMPPVNGLHMYTKREKMHGSWSLDPLVPMLPTRDLVQTFLDGKAPRRRCFRTPKGVTPTASFTSRHGSVQATLRVTGQSPLHSTATIRSKTRSGNITLDLVSIDPTRTVHIDARSRRGNVTLLVPRNFSGIVQLSSRHGPVEVLPVLAASGRVLKTMDKEATVLIGDGPMPQVGADHITDTARLYSRHGRIRLGFSGEDYFIEPPKLIDQAVKMVQKLITEKLITHKVLPPKRGVNISFT